MSILIKGLEMPKDGALLCLRIYPSGVVRTCFSPPQPPDSKIATAIPISYHGDLIDRDALSDAMYHEAYEVDSSDMKTWDKGLCWIRYKLFENKRDDAPVVIPAERSE